jgi:hypothetical protein
MKMVKKGRTAKERARCDRLLSEFDVYRVIEENRSKAKMKDVVP